jgi:drug/metabolite transporter (DMT)-like permease
MSYLGEFISISVALSWTMSALFFEYAGKKIGSLSVNLIRLVFGFLMLGGLLLLFTGSMLPVGADAKTWFWMSLSGLVGFVFGDLCLFYSYLIITARFSQLLMTLAPPFAALFGWILLGEKLTGAGFLGMAVTLTGIAISVLKRGSNSSSGVINEGVIKEGVAEVSAVNENTPVIAEGKKTKIIGNLHLHLPLKGVLLGIGGALGQGLGIVLSKQGMISYHEALGADSPIGSFVPFAATQIRIITGVVGFVLIILLSKRMEAFKGALKNRKGITATFFGSIFGPFVGVSLSLMAVQYTNTAIASTIMATTPIIIIVPYILLYKKRISAVEILGALLSVGGVSLFFLL